MKEIVQLDVIRYRDTNGNPTCIADLQNDEVCDFLRAFNVGKRYCCHWDKPSYLSRPILARGDDGSGSLIPIDACPLWNGEKR